MTNITSLAGRRLLFVSVLTFAALQSDVVSAVKGVPTDDGPCTNGQVEENGACVPPPAVNEQNKCPHFEVKEESIVNYLNPDLFEDPQIMEDIRERLRNDELVVIKDAFIPEFAEAMHCDLDNLDSWELQDGYSDYGFHYSHHNIYDWDDFSPFMKATRLMYEHEDSKEFMADLTGRDTYGDSWGSGGAASWYWPGDHSLPHSDHMRQRTVAFVWHLSKNWQPEWGGALYWTQEDLNHAYVHASFNTLSLFSVRSGSSHFVTTVSPHAQEKRLSFNGWYQSDWHPSLDDDLEELLSTEEQRWDLTCDQVDILKELIYDNDELDEDRSEELHDLMERVEDELYPERYSSYIVEPRDQATAEE